MHNDKTSPPKGIKIVSLLQRVHGENGAQTLTFKYVTTDKQTDKQRDKNSTFLGVPAAGEI